MGTIESNVTAQPIGDTMNLTNEQKQSVKVTFSVNRYEAYTHDGVMIGAYYSKDAMMAEFRKEGIRSKLTGMAITKFKEGY